MPGGVYCPNCQTKVILEQDGVSCSNCGAELVRPLNSPKPRAAPKPPTPTPDVATQNASSTKYTPPTIY